MAPPWPSCALSAALAGGRKLSCIVSSMRDQTSCTGRLTRAASIAACSIAAVSSFRP
jgi:hypothetical protein